MQIERTAQANDLVVNGLPDGSRVIVDSKNERVYALNVTAGAAWDACKTGTTLSQLTEEMKRTCDPSITEEFAEEAVRELEEKNLVKSSGLFGKPSRRQLLAGLSAVALPLVVSMTLSEQRAFAESAQSGNPTPDRPEAHVTHETDIKL